MMGWASPETDDERTRVAIHDAGYDSGWNDALDAVIEAIQKLKIAEAKAMPRMAALSKSPRRG